MEKICDNCKHMGQTKMCLVNYPDLVSGGAPIQVTMRRARESASYCGLEAKFYEEKGGEDEHEDLEMYVELSKDPKGASYLRVVVDNEGLPNTIATLDRSGRLSVLPDEDAERCRKAWFKSDRKVSPNKAVLGGIPYGIDKTGKFYYRIKPGGEKFCVFDFAKCLPGKVNTGIIQCYMGTNIPRLHK